MGKRSVEQTIRSSSGAAQVLRIDLHGVSLSSVDGTRTAIRWEWIEDITGDDETVIRAASGTIAIPRGTFGAAPDVLAAKLHEAKSIIHRTNVIQELSELPLR